MANFGSVIGKSLQLGFIGNVSRNGVHEIGARIVKIDDGTQYTVPFGSPVVLNTDNSFSKFGSTGTGVSAPTVANFAGFAVRIVKQALTYLSPQIPEYQQGEACSVLYYGSMVVQMKDNANNAPVAGGQVYICTDKGTGTIFEVGDLFATATPNGITDETIVALTDVKFTTGKVDTIDTIEITEVSILKKVNP